MPDRAMADPRRTRTAGARRCLLPSIHAVADRSTNALEPRSCTFDMQADGRGRVHGLHVPSGYDGLSPAPLVVDMRGYSSNREGQAFTRALTQKSDGEGFSAANLQGYLDSLSKETRRNREKENG